MMVRAQLTVSRGRGKSIREVFKFIVPQLTETWLVRQVGTIRHLQNYRKGLSYQLQNALEKLQEAEMWETES